MYINNILITYFKMFSAFKGITFQTNEKNINGAIVVIVPFITCNTTNEITIKALVSNNKATSDVLGEFIEFLRTDVLVGLQNECYKYEFTFTDVSNLIIEETKENYQEYQINLKVFAKKTEI